MKRLNRTGIHSILAMLLAIVLSVFTACGSAPSGGNEDDGKQEDPPVVTLTGISIKTMPTKTVYVVGEEFEVDGMELTLKFDDESSEDISVTADMVSGYDKEKAGTQYLTVTCVRGAVTRKTAFTVTVNERPPEPTPDDPDKPDVPDIPDVPDVPDEPEEDYRYTYGDEYSWNITEANGVVSFESQNSSQYLMFNKLRFAGGSVSFKLKTENNDFTYSVADGIVFGADTLDAAHNTGKFYVCGRDRWNDYLVFSKDNGAFKWQDSTKIANTLTELGKTYDLKFVWDSEKDLVYYFIDGEYAGKQQLDKGFKGSYIGLYADHAGVIISDIVIDENETFEITNETDEYKFTEGDSTNWDITGTGASASFTAKKSSQMLMFKNRTFSGGSLSFKLKDETNDYSKALVNGVVFAADSIDSTHAAGSFYCVGRDKWKDLVMCSRTGGTFAWEDSTKIAFALNVLGKTYDLKFVWDSEKDLVYYFIDGVYVGKQQLDKGFKGDRIGIYADCAGTVISDIVIDETEKFTPPEIVTETDEYKFTEGDSTNWKITGTGESASFTAMKGSQFLMFKNRTFSGGSVSFKLKVESNEYTFSVASGILFGADTLDAAHNTGKFYVCGRDRWNDYLVFSKDNGAFAWQDSTKIANILTDFTKTYDLKFVWDSEKDMVYYFIDGEYVGQQQLNKGFNGGYIGIYADCAGTVISDIVIDENETYTSVE